MGRLRVSDVTVLCAARRVRLLRARAQSLVRLVGGEQGIEELLLPRRHAQLPFRDRRLALDGRHQAADVGGEGVLGGRCGGGGPRGVVVGRDGA